MMNVDRGDLNEVLVYNTSIPGLFRLTAATLFRLSAPRGTAAHAPRTPSSAGRVIEISKLQGVIVSSFIAQLECIEESKSSGSTPGFEC